MTQRPTLSLKKKTQVTLEQSKLIEKPSQAPTGKTSGLKKQQQEIKEAKKLKEAAIKQAQAILNNFNLTYPFALGIGRELTHAIKEQGASYKPSKIAIQRLVTSEKYLTALLTGSHRYNLDGSEASEITPEERAFAQQELERKAALKEARKLKKAAKKEQRIKEKSSPKTDAD